MNLLSTAAGPLPAWTGDAIKLLQPTLGVMAKPVIENNLKRVCAHLPEVTAAEMDTFLERVRTGIRTFAAAGDSDRLVDQLRSALLVRRS